MFRGDSLEFMEHYKAIHFGWASSHGCIRMDNKEVAELYNLVPIGTKVTIIEGPYGEFGKGYRVLKSGMYGSDVLEIQKKLKK